MTDHATRAEACRQRQQQDEDFVASVVRIVAGCAGGMDEALALQIEERIRSEYAGERPYIAREGWNNLEERNQRIRAEAMAGRSLRWISSRHSISVRQIGRILANVDD